MRLLALGVTAISLLAAAQACGQSSGEIEKAVNAAVASASESPTSLGWSIYRPQPAADHSPDSAEVYFNRDGKPTAWRAWFGSRYYVHYDGFGTFEVTDSIAVAYETLKTKRDVIELLDLLEQVERAAKTKGVAVQE